MPGASATEHDRGVAGRRRRGARAGARQALDDAELAIIDKRRPRPNESKVMNIIGEVEGKTCVLIDDMVDTAGTLCQAAQALKDEGATRWWPTSRTRCCRARAVERISEVGAR
jgi:ribose-phosphate pyrophosphokinase